MTYLGDWKTSPVWKYFCVIWREKMYPVHKRTESGVECSLLFFLWIPKISSIISTFRTFNIWILQFSTDLVSNRYDYMRFRMRLWLTFGSLMVHLTELMWFSVLILWKLWFIVEFTILPSKVKEPSKFWYDLGVNQFMSNNQHLKYSF